MILRNRLMKREFKMIELLNKLTKEGIRLQLDGDDIRVIYSGDSLPPDILLDLKENKHKLLSYLREEEQFTIAILPVEEKEAYELSPGQKRIWFTCQMDLNSTAYNLSNIFELGSQYNFDRLQRAFFSTVQRHESLRTVFRQDQSGNVYQYILDDSNHKLAIQYCDLTQEANHLAKFQDVINEISDKPFDLEKGPLLRVVLFQLKEGTQIFYLNIHHILCDGVSLEVLKKDMLGFYESSAKGTSFEQAPLKIQYKDFAHWQLSEVNQKSTDQHRRFWKEYLSGFPDSIGLPENEFRPKFRTDRGIKSQQLFDKQTLSRLHQFGQKNEMSLFMTLLACWKVLLYHSTGNRDLIVGTSVTGRDGLELSNQIGFYVNMMVLRNQISPEHSFEEFCKELRNNTLLAYEHQNYPFDKLVEDLGIQRDFSRNPVFDITITLHNYKQRSKLELTELGYFIEELNSAHLVKSKFDLEISFTEYGETLYLEVIHNPDVYDQKMVKGLIQRYECLLDLLIEQPEKKIADVDHVLEREVENLKMFNSTQVGYEGQTLLDLFKDHYQKNPGRICAVSKENSWSQEDLEKLSNQFAQYLKKVHGCEKGDHIGIKLPPNEWLLIAILGIFKCGGTYVPLDLNYPPDRTDFIVKDSGSVLTITQHEIEEFRGIKQNISANATPLDLLPEDLAYIIYTSGSTGRPKGVKVSHKALHNYISWARTYYLDETVSEIGLYSSLAFDLTITTIFLPLVSNIRLKLFETEDISKLLQHYFEPGSTTDIIKLTPSHILLLRELRISKTDIKKAIVGGEKLKPIHVDILRSLNNSMQIYNEYGPTETTVGCTAAKINDSSSISIGSPISNTQIYILSESLKQLPIGLVGEICIGGKGVSEGYLNRNELTAQKFIENPFTNGEKIYRTGDLGYWTHDGNIQYEGRMDNQVKMNGFRIELGEIETVMLSLEQIQEAIAIISADPEHQSELVVYYSSDQTFQNSELKNHLQKKLPHYMIPRFFVRIEKIPLTKHGKLDFLALPSPFGIQVNQDMAYAEPENQIEKELISMIADLLHVDQGKVSVLQNFFDLGLNSMKLIVLIASVNKHFNAEIKLVDLFEYPTIRDFARRVIYDNSTNIGKENDSPMDMDEIIDLIGE